MKKHAAEGKSLTAKHEVWHRLAKNKVAMGALFLLIIIILSAVFADYIAPYDYAEQDYGNMFQYPSKEHWMGTDNFGRDIFSRVLKGGQVSLLVAITAVAGSLLVGAILGATAGYFGGAYGAVVMRLMDVIMALPGLLMAMMISAVLGTGIVNTIIAVGFSAIPVYARLMYATVLSLRNQEYIEASAANGARHSWIILKHIIPNAISPMIVTATLRVGNTMMSVSSLSFIGLGVQPPTPEWGSILSAGRQFIRDFYPIIVFPGIMIALTLIAFNLFGDGLRDAMDPKLKR